MILFASSITDPELYKQCAEPGIRLAKEPGSLVIANAAAGSIFRSYNLIMDSVAERDDLEALVLLHQDSELASPDFCATLRAALSDDDVGVVGCVGAVGVRSIAWWEGSVTWASFTHRYRELGGGELPALSWEKDGLPAFAQTGEVDTVDGFVLCLSPWVVRNVRFDESLGLLHGYDFDFCMQVRAAGKKVVTADFRAVHNHSLDLVSDPEGWVEAHVRHAEKWEGKVPGATAVEVDWRAAALRARAEAEASRAAAVSKQMLYDAREREYRRVLEEMEASIGWRLTEPLRRANHLRRRLLARRRG
jgi:Glycosyltransferase like family